MIKNTNKGLKGEQKKFEISFDYERTVSMKDGLPVVVFFSKTPYKISKTISFEYHEVSEIDAFISDCNLSKLKFLETYESPYIESFTIGPMVGIANKTYFECTKTETKFTSKPGEISVPTAEIKYTTASINPMGYYNGLEGPLKLAMFPAGYFSKITIRQYIGSKSINKVGDLVDGIVSNVQKSNPRWNKNQLIYDFVETSVSLTGTKIS